jgi:6-phosphogluconolactonase (cycloisomerase 2 family)
MSLAATLAVLACSSSAQALHDGGVDTGMSADGAGASGGLDGGAAGLDGGAAGLDGGAAGLDGGAAGLDGGAAGLDGGTAADPPPESLFVATYLGGLSSFTVDDVTGRPQPAGAPFDEGAQLYALALHPSGRFAYATDFRGTVIGYVLTPGAGASAHVPGSPVAVGSAAIAAAVDPAGKFLYVGDTQSLHVFSIDPATGALTGTAHSPFDIGGQPCTIAFHPSGRFLFASFGAIGPEGHGGLKTFALDVTSGAPTEVDGSPLLNDQVRGGAVTVHPNGKFLYVGSFSSLHGFLVDEETGALAPLPGLPVPGGNSDATAIDVAIDPQGRYLYATDFVGSVYGYRIDGASGALSAVPGSPFDGRPSPYSLAIDPAGRFVYVGNDDANLLSVFSLDPASGALAPIAGSPFNVTGLQPELALAAAAGRGR